MSVERPRLLMIETSSRTGLVALGENDLVVGVRRLDEARRHARDLAPAVRELLDATAWRPRDIDAVVVGLGPGSYTGLRVGIMSAKTFCYATGAAIVGVDTLATLAAQSPPEVSRLDVVADAQQERVYLQSFQRADDNSMQALASLRICAASEWLSSLSEEVWISGPAAEMFLQRQPSLRTVAPDLRIVQPASLLGIGLRRFRAGLCDDLWKIEPLYLRPSAAEEQWRRHHGSDVR